MYPTEVTCCMYNRAEGGLNSNWVPVVPDHRCREYFSIIIYLNRSSLKFRF